MSDFARIRAILDAATPGPWVTQGFLIHGPDKGGIEREAVATFLASPEAAEGLARALGVIPPIPDEFLLHKTWVTSDWLPNAPDYAAAILAAWQKEREG